MKYPTDQNFVEVKHKRYNIQSAENIILKKTQRTKIFEKTESSY